MNKDELTCLVVDDEPPVRRALTRLMESDGYVCWQAGSGEEALEVLRSHEVTVLLDDVRLPGMDGIELLRQVRAQFPDTAVVVVTAVADVDVAVSCLAMGAADYVTKPFRPEEVRVRVHQALEKRQLVLDNRAYQAQLEQRVGAQARRLEEFFVAAMQALASALEAKDPYTQGHSIRVSHIAVAIARAMAVAPDMVRQIDIGSHLHDIGKIGVREDVLNKPGPLSDEEYKHIMTHPVLGWQILSSLLAEVPLALNVVRSHHERFDGRGVPDGLSADQIPLEARIAAVADAFDAMSTGRAYRRGGALALPDALSEIERCRGSQFDPAVVDAFLRVIAQGAIDLPAPGRHAPQANAA